MDARAESPLEGELVEHAGWLRALARRLVRDESEADDLVQEAWLAALRRPPRAGTSWRPWLGRVVRTLALRRWRRPPSAPIEESSAGATSSPAELFERLEAGRILIEELQALRVAERRVIVLRYFDGLDAPAIAARTGEPEGTVRWRLHEGLALLRRRLDARYGGDRPSWCRALALSSGAGTTFLSVPRDVARPLAASGAPATASLPFGVFLVNTATKITAAVVAMLSVSTGLYLWIDGPGRAVPVERVASDVAPSMPVAITDAKDLAQPAETERSTVARTALAVEDKPASAAIPAPIPVRVEARALDATLVPIADARLAHLGEPAHAAQSRGDGSLVLELPAREQEQELAFTLAAAGFGTRFLQARARPGATLFLGDVVLAPGGTVSGRVVDSRERGLAGVEVIAARPVGTGGFGSTDFEVQREQGPQFDVGAPRALSLGDGTFRIEGIEAGVVRLWARGEDLRWNVSEPADVVAREETPGVTLTVRAADEQDAALAPIEGIVVDERGEPVPKANVAVTYRGAAFSSKWTVQAGDDGRFRIAVKGRGAHDLVVKDPEQRLVDALLTGVVPGTRGLELALAPARRVRLAVKEGGRAVERFTVTALAETNGMRSPAAEGELHEDGRVLLQVPRFRFRYLVDAPGFWTAELGPYEPAEVPEELEVDLDAAPGIHGRVLVAGEPRAGVRVRLHEKPRAMRIEVNGYRSTNLPTPEAETTTDPYGAFALDLRADGQYVLLADADGYARTELGPLDLVAAEGRRDLEIVLGAGGAIEGRVRMPPGRDVAGVIVAVNRGDGAPRTQVVGRDGTFRFERLTPGPWEVRRVKEEFVGVTSWATSNDDGGVEREIEASCRVLEGETTRFDLDLSDWKPAVLVLDLSTNGAAARAWVATLWPSGESSVTGTLPAGTTDAAGRVRIEVDDARAYDLTVRPPPETHSDFQTTFRAVALAGGENALEKRLVLGRAEGRVAGDHGSPLRYRPHAKGEGASGPLEIGLDDEGRFVLPFVPAGPGTFERASGVGKAKIWTPIGTAEVAASETLRVDLP